MIALREHAVLVQRDEQSQRLRRQTLNEYCVGRTIAFEYAMRREPLRRALSLHFFLRLAERQRLGLRK